MSGIFIVLEGGEGSGKSTQVVRLARRLRDRGYEVVETFEPGATVLGVGIRSALLHGSEPLDPHAELMLLVADRAQHVAEVVRPALERGVVVVSDRHTPSSLAYQGRGRGLGVVEVERLSNWATDGLRADLVVVLDVSEEVARERQVAPPDRLESAGESFHAEVRAAYRELAAERGWVVVDGSADEDAVAESIWNHVARSMDLNVG